MRLHYTFDTVTEYSAPVIDHQLALRCAPMADAVQRVEQFQLVLDPLPACLPRAFVDGFGTTVRWVSLAAPHTRLHYGSSGVVEVDLRRAGAAVPPGAALRWPGQRTRPGAALQSLWGALPHPESPEALCALLCDEVHRRIEYRPGVTGMRTDAEQALTGGQGVCQDFAQIYLALARLGGLPARYCMGLTVGEGATHAWAEVYYGGAWHGWDPTRGCAADERYLRFGTGRDAADCPVEQGVFRGAADQTQTVFMRVEPAP
ncbi:MAG: transglutaminase domain-containing protein [Gemmiger sp.]